MDREAYDRYINSSRWKRVRIRAFQFYGRACQACGVRDGLHVHHVTYERFGHERLADLRILCETHHDLVHHLARAGGRRLGEATDMVINAYAEHTPDPSPIARAEHKHQRPPVVDWRMEVRQPSWIKVSPRRA